MGAWGCGVFENDSALDWLGEAEESGLAAASEVALRLALGGGYLEVEEGSSAVAAAALLAAANDGDAGGLPAAAKLLVAAGVSPSGPARALAVEALDAVLGARSELASLWGKGPSATLWRDGVQRLQRRLGASPA